MSNVAALCCSLREPGSQPVFAAVIEMWHCVSDFNETWEARPTLIAAVSRWAWLLFTMWSRSNCWWLFGSNFCSLVQLLSFSPETKYIRFFAQMTHIGMQPLKLKTGNQWYYILSFFLSLPFYHCLLCRWNNLPHRQSSWVLSAVTWTTFFRPRTSWPLLYII